MNSQVRRGLGCLAVGALLLLIGGGDAAAQIPDEFTNLQVFPKEMGKRELISVMRDFAGALGVRCNHCHVGESVDSLEGYDFASDDLEPKQVARAMMKMTREINDGLLPKTGRDSLMRVRCVTCHRGVLEPHGLDAIVLEIIESDGVESAIGKYRSLHAEHYGGGAYDFSAGTLNQVAETVAQERQDIAGALELMQLNVEFNPEDANAHIMLGQLYMMSGDKDAAVASMERALELDPENDYARRLLERVRPAD
ncbi:MAG: c-type cytochrome [Planctomycetota bacterium]|jgi:tetratricopeptide (TPR) repeat protein